MIIHSFILLLPACYSLILHDTATRTKTEFRLVGGKGPWEGRVEVFHNGEFGTVCDDGFGQKEANVICTMLGYDPKLHVSAKAVDSTKFGEGSGRIWLDEVNCTGHENDIADCHSNAWGDTDCDHSEDIAVICPITSVRLQGGHNSSIGRIELNIQTWRPLCSAGWSVNEATVICRMLGQEPKSGHARAITIPSYFGSYSSTSPVFSNVSCNGDEFDIVLCKHTAASSCPSGAFAAVSCIPIGPVRTKISLQGGSNQWEGDVAIKRDYYSSSFRPICSWKTSSSIYNDNLASVVCNMLGYHSWSDKKPTYSVHRSNSYNYNYETDVWMEDVACVGDEVDIADCLSKNGITGSRCQMIFRVVCPRPPTPNITGVQLAGGRFAWEGRVLVNNWGHWGGVCYQHWTKNVAAVVCRMLGFHAKHVLAIDAGSFTSGNESAELSQYSCRGNETNLNQCSLTAPSSHPDCTERAGLRCVEFEVKDVVEVQCNKHSWLVVVNMTLLKALYPKATSDKISMGHVGRCHGHEFGDSLLFYYLLADCLTATRQEEEQTVYINHLSYVDESHQGADKTVWKQHLYCTVYREGIPPSNHTLQDQPIDISFYSDPRYLHALPEGSLPTRIDTRVYVRVSPVNPTPLKMILKNCQIIETGSGTHALIKNGCETNTSTHISLMSDVESRFSFSPTWTQTSTQTPGRGHVTCDVKFCDVNDENPACYHGCRKPMQLPVIG